ncbi:MAG: outer membrane protein assembly factor BamD [Alphaproteobacteria bacterium]|nr:outer membrane protein assembly factor BamD [Alphaproteobacteria bacterium]
MDRWVAPRIVAAALAALLVFGCADKEPEYIEKPVEELYNKALDSLLAENYKTAVKEFDEVERQHPYSIWASKAQLMSAYGSYMINKYDDAILSAERFIQVHPGSRDAAYAYYLVALCYYEQITDVGRDQKITEQAMTSLEDIIRRFPNSEYARDARLKLDMTRDHLAGKDMEIGRYYQKRGMYVGAINRFRSVIENYQTTSHAPEALHRLTETYLALGVAREAQSAAAVLGHNFPGSAWYADSYVLLVGRDLKPEKDEGSWISRAFRSIF